MRLNIFGKRQSTEETRRVLEEEAIRELASVFGHCVHCGSGLSGQEYARLATEIASDEDLKSLTRFFQVVKEHDWLTLRSFRRWEGRTNNVEAYAVRCSTQHVSVAVIKAPFEFLEPDQLLTCERLDADEIPRFQEAFSDVEWRRFP